MSFKRIFTYVFFGLILVGGLFAWRVFGSNTAFEGKSKVVLIGRNTSYSDLQVTLDTSGVVKNTRSFALVANILGYPNNMKPGRYVVAKGASIYQIIKQLKSGNQTPLNLVITKLRTKEDLAKKIGAAFECDSAEVISFLYNPDSLQQYGYDTNTVMTAIIPDTYSLLWTTSFPKLFKRLDSEKQRFWTEARKQKATSLGLTPNQVYTLASIVEEETNKAEDKGPIASVYLNRMDQGMALGADPTVKYALRDFGMKRIYQKHLQVQSTYNTYLNKGLPPGPICTPSRKTIDAVLDAPATNYLYFVAKPELNGYSNFATTYPEHLHFAKIYQESLNKRGILK